MRAWVAASLYRIRQNKPRNDHEVGLLAHSVDSGEYFQTYDSQVSYRFAALKRRIECALQGQNRTENV